MTVICLSVYPGAHTMVRVWRSEGSPWGPTLLFYHVGPRDLIHQPWLQALYLPSYLAGRPKSNMFLKSEDISVLVSESPLRAVELECLPLSVVAAAL